MSVQIITGDCREVLAKMPDESAHCCVTSPPYWGLRDYGIVGQIGLEPNFEDWLASMVRIFQEIRRVLRSDGTLWLNIGDAYCASPKGNLNGQDKSSLTSTKTQENSPAGVSKLGQGWKPKDLLMMPARLAMALQADGWWLRSEIIWAKPNPMPESVIDRPTSAHEKVYLLSKRARYYYDAEAVRETQADTIHTRSRYKYDPSGWKKAQTNKDVNWSGDELTQHFGNGSRNLRNVWEIATAPFRDAHFATFPPKLVEPCIKAGCPIGGTVLDPFGGSGTTGLVADRLGRNAVLIELSPDYADMARERLTRDAGMFAEVS